MKKRFRDLTEKYRSFRLQSDAIYDSRIIQTFFNKFIKQGKKTFSRRQLTLALSRLRFEVSCPRTFNILLRMLKSFYIPLLLVARRQGKIILEIPVPVRRNKRDTINIQIFYNAVNLRRERTLCSRLVEEFLALTLHRNQSTVLRNRSQLFSKIYEERVNIDKR